MEIIAGLIGLILMLLMLVLIIVASIITYILPTAINFTVSYLILFRFIKFKDSKVLFATLFILISFLLGTNIRLSGIISDFNSDYHEEKSVVEPIVLDFGTPISVESNIEIISYKNNPLDYTTIGGNEGCMCLYTVKPKVIKEKLPDILLKHGLQFDNRKKQDVQIRMNYDGDNYKGVINIDIISDNKVQASLNRRIRRQHFGETLIGENSSKNSVLHYFIYGNIWRYLLEAFQLKNGDDKLIEGFIRKNIKVSKHKKVIFKGNAIEYLNFDPLESFMIKNGILHEFIDCKGISNEDSKIEIDQSHTGLKIVGNEYTIPIDTDFYITEKIICTNGGINVVSTPRRKQSYFYIEQYDYRGGNTKNYKFMVEEKNWKAHLGLIYFLDTNDVIYVGIVDYGTNTERKKTFYALDKKDVEIEDPN